VALECGALGIFLRKGSFLDAAAGGEERERRVRSRLHGAHSSLFSLSLSLLTLIALSIFPMPPFIGLWTELSHFWTIASLFCVFPSVLFTSLS